MVPTELVAGMTGLAGGRFCPPVDELVISEGAFVLIMFELVPGFWLQPATTASVAAAMIVTRMFFVFIKLVDWLFPPRPRSATRADPARFLAPSTAV